MDGFNIYIFTIVVKRGFMMATKNVMAWCMDIKRVVEMLDMVIQKNGSRDVCWDGANWG